MPKSALPTREDILACMAYVLREAGPKRTPSILCQTVYQMAVISIEDPKNRAKQRQYQMWSDATREFMATHMNNSDRTFEQHVTDEDRALVARFGIRLD
jgi:hypothetical protein